MFQPFKTVLSTVQKAMEKFGTALEKFQMDDGSHSKG